MMPITFTQAVLVVMVVFYSSVLTKGTSVKRVWMLWIGMVALVVSVLAMFFVCGRAPKNGLVIATNIFHIITAVVSVKCFFGAMYPGKIPIWDDIFPPAGSEPKKDETTPQM